ncbi:MAG: pyridoxamine 5'-phosphate oxidase family protein [Patescibacteria group bacterium]|jgi:predicted pyridoxine 5'-phosphate oxidase superfamily flavin-nucleotide-binding protein
MNVIAAGVKKLIENNAVALATIGKNGRPHAIAVAYCKVFGDKIIISNTHILETINNLKTNKYVSLAVWNKEWEVACAGFELKGVAENQTSGKWFDFVKQMPDNKGYDVKSAIVVTVAKVKKLIS